MDTSKSTAFVARGRSISCNRGEVVILIPADGGGSKSRYELVGEQGQLPAGTEVEMAAAEVARLIRSGHLVAEDPGLQVPSALRAALLPSQP